MGVIDFSNVSSGFDPIAPGTYAAKVTGIEMKQGPKGPYIKWEMTLSDPELSTRKVWYNTSLSPQSLWNLKQMLLEAFSFSAEELSTSFDTDTLLDLVGTDVAVVLVDDEYQGNPTTRVAAVKHESQAGDSSTPLV